jgi:ribonucleoside-diphosphate reductase alpha chain
LLVTSTDLRRLMYLGFAPKRLQIEQHKPQRCARHFVKVVAVEDHGRRDDTYCFNEPMRHMGVFNGILTGNCSEIVLPTGIDHLGLTRVDSKGARRNADAACSALPCGRPASC